MRALALNYHGWRVGKTIMARGMNRLAKEASPYLVQHGNNPVDWFPWGEEALARARAEDKPILLSIGYSACHWCHVMERESFEDAATAKLMNELYVSIKVDREERPDLDQIYQLVVQIMGRSGGWPLTVFLTPDQKPFFGGTYYPPVPRHGMPAFSQVLAAVADAYKQKREDVVAQAGELAAAIAKATQVDVKAGFTLGPHVLERAVFTLGRRFDETNGGFGTRPKFPNTMPLEALLRRGALDGDAGSLARVVLALDAMRAGGIYDQLGGGFHRYSTDEKWLVPHFEKMLYDNALLLRLNTDAWRATKEPRFAATVREIAAYVAREMTAPDGGFYATQDADSEGEEGKFFVWTPAEIDGLLSADEYAAAREVFGITDEGNFEESGATVLSLVNGAGEAETPALVRAKAKMLAAREKRVKPFRDEKILASWNGLMIRALADAGAALRDAGMVEAASRALAFVKGALVKDGRIVRLVKDGITRGPGFLDDYACVAAAALELYEATGDASHVVLARALADAILAHFWDDETAELYFTPDDGEALIHRAKDPWDHAVPSGTAIALEVLARLGVMVDERYGKLAERGIERLAAAAMENPFGMAQTREYRRRPRGLAGRPAHAGARQCGVRGVPPEPRHRVGGRRAAPVGRQAGEGRARRLRVSRAHVLGARRDGRRAPGVAAVRKGGCPRTHLWDGWTVRGPAVAGCVARRGFAQMR
jgi:uncharacterized protein